ncbi:uncharacterized protein LOC116214556 [Punica granatum]|uniref:Uncharacterized protein LOC116214556 n=1 Tax=Punica granatum TaxID=22663 RepID=A0A6P8E748_PUNGR|nr:uncharacterized protein LOC116214556 [Punica granatum]
MLLANISLLKKEGRREEEEEEEEEEETTTLVHWLAKKKTRKNPEEEETSISLSSFCVLFIIFSTSVEATASFVQLSLSLTLKSLLRDLQLSLSQRSLSRGATQDQSSPASVPSFDMPKFFNRPSTFNSADSSSEAVISSSLHSIEAAVPQIMQEKLMIMAMQKEEGRRLETSLAQSMEKIVKANRDALWARFQEENVKNKKLLQDRVQQIMAMQKEEGRRLETSLAQSMEKIVKANGDALWARFQEETVTNDKLLQVRVQQRINLLANFINKDLPATIERIVKREVAAVQIDVLRAITPAIEKTIVSAITESFQKGVGDKAINQLEKSVNSKLEASVAREIVAQFQTSGRRALQDALKSSMVASMVPPFEKSCKAMFEHFDATLQRGMTEHTSAAMQHLENANSPLTHALRDVINSASSITHTLNGELAEAQRKLICLAVGGANPSAITPLVTQPSNGPLGKLHEKVDIPIDPRKALSRLISEHEYEEAFTSALLLQRRDVSTLYCLLVMLSEAEEKRAREEKKIMHYSSNHNILLVGEGDFSFATCLAQAFGSAPNIVATSLDSRVSLERKYSRASINLKELEDRGCTVLHGVDAHTMSTHPSLILKSFDRIVYNFPHAGFFYKEDDLQQIRIHKELVKGFLKSASSMLSYNGQVHITHKTNYPFSAWDIVGLAEEVGLYLLDEDNFKPWMYPGYVNKRGDGHRSDESFLVGLCSTYKFTKL